MKSREEIGKKREWEEIDRRWWKKKDLAGIKTKDEEKDMKTDKNSAIDDLTEEAIFEKWNVNE